MEATTDGGRERQRETEEGKEKKNETGGNEE